jgi:hypothetical protein
MLSYQALADTHRILWQLSQNPANQSQELQDSLTTIGNALNNQHYAEQIYTLEFEIQTIGNLYLWQSQSYSKNPSDFVKLAAQESLTKNTRIRQIGTDWHWEFQKGTLYLWTHEQTEINRVAKLHNLYLTIPESTSVGKNIESISNLTTGVKNGDRGEIIMTRSRNSEAGGIDYLIRWESKLLLTNPHWANASHIKFL